ncbi:MAG: flagellar biosynthesis protein FlhF [Alteromonadaceae bacterium]|nr:MAG: flagellar biosynthesis protein FlhF [Alteromonadaceae bacterium]
MTHHNSKQVKRFVAPTMSRALELVQKELGPEAVILSSKRIDKGVEIVTSSEADIPTRGFDVRREFGQNFDADLDTAMSSDSAWSGQADIDKAAAKYQGKTQKNEDRQKRNPASEDLALEIERARERMLAAKREAREREKPEPRGQERYQESRSTAPRNQDPRSQESRTQEPRYSSDQYVDDRYADTRVNPNEEYDDRRYSQQNSERSMQEPMRSHQPRATHSQHSQAPDESSAYSGHPQDQRPRYPEHSERQEYQGGHVDRGNIDGQGYAQHPSPYGGEQAQYPQGQRFNELQDELADMRMLLEQQLWHLMDGSQQNSSQQGSNWTAAGQIQQQLRVPNQYAMLNERLRRLGLPDQMIDGLVLELGQHKHANQAWRESMAILSRKIPVLKNNSLSCKGIFAFVGQTGVGKTTTIAKLAAQYVLKHGPGKVALVSTDSFRVGAQDQLRSMGRILNVPVKTVDAQNSLTSVLSGLRQFPLVLVDTAGFRHGDPLLKNQLKQLDACVGVKRILVMSCNSQLQTMKASAHAYSSAKGVDACVLTKLDEAASLGEAISVVIEHGLPVAYTTDGQEIPADISVASGHNLVAKAVAMIKGQESKANHSVAN